MMIALPSSNSDSASSSNAPPRGSAALGADPYRIALQALRGRYLLATLLTLGFATIGGWIGYRLQQPSYRSEGLIRIAFSPRPMASEGDESRQMSVFQEFLHNQVLVLTSRSLVERALRDRAWEAVGRDTSSPGAVASFARQMVVDHPVKTEHLRITFTDNDPVAAAAGVNAALAAYTELYEANGYQSDQDRLHVLEAQRSDLADRLAAAQAQTARIAGEFGSAQFKPLFEAKLQEVARLESALADTRVALAVVEHPAAASPKAGAPTRDLTVNQISLLDPQMRDYLTERNRIETQLLQTRANGALEGNADVIRLKALLALQDERIKRQADDFRQGGIGAASAPGVENRVGAAAGQSVDSLRQGEKELTRMCEQSRAEMVALGSKTMQIEATQATALDLSRKLADVDREIDRAKLQGILGGKLQIVSQGTVPALPIVDPRAKMALAGAVGAGALPIAALVLLGIVWRRHWRPDEPELQSQGVRLLGAIPLLPPGNVDPQQAALSDYCHHQVRVMLQVLRASDKPAVYLVTSPCAGDGKTRLTRILGESFAQSGSKTLVIDCDMIGRGLTRSLGAPQHRGLVECLRSGTMKNSLVTTETARLWALTAGMKESQGSELSPVAFRRLLTEARTAFNTILIDTGPALSCIEASLLASEVDGVILAITRGEPQPLVERTLRHLDSIGARTTGIVFNRARPGDLLAYGYGSTRSASGTPEALVPLNGGDSSVARSTTPAASVMRRVESGARHGASQRLRHAPPIAQERSETPSDSQAS